MISTEYHDKIARLFSIAANDIQINNLGYGYYNINKFSENCIAKIFSEIYGVTFIVLEEINVNFPAVDIGAADGSVYVQITSEVKANKIKDTLVSVVNHDLSKKYDRLIIMFLASSYRPTISKENIEKHIFNETGEEIDISNIGFDLKKSIFDFSNLAKVIRDKVFEVSRLTRIYEVLEQEYRYYRYSIEAISNFPFESIANSINTRLEDKSLKESLLYLANYYEPAIVIPEEIFCAVHPFNEDEKLFVENFALTISNANLFSEFKQILENPINDNWDEKTRVILKFLRLNGIGTIQLFGHRQKLDVPQYHDGMHCECERCSFERLNYTVTLDYLLKIRTTRNFEDIEYPLRTIYISINIGDFVLAKDLCEYHIENGDQDNPIYQFILERSLYHLSLKQDITVSLLNERGVVFPDTLIASYAYQGVDREKTSFLTWLNSEEYILNALNEVQQIRIKASDNSFGDSYGHPPPINNSFELVKSLNLPLRVLWGNLVPSFESKYYHQLLIESVNAFFEIYSMNFQNFNRVDPEIYLSHWIKDIPPPLLRNLFRSLPNKKIKRSTIRINTALLPFISRLQNLTSSLSSIDRYIELTQADQVKKQVEKTYINSLLFSRKFELNQDEYEVLLDTIGEAITTFPSLMEEVVSDFCFFIHLNFNQFSKSLKNKAFLLYQNYTVISDYQRTINFKRSGLFEDYFQGNIQEELNYIAGSLVKSGMGYELNALFEDLEFMSDKQRHQFKDLLVLALQKRSTPILIYEGVVNDIINLDDYKDNFVKETLKKNDNRYKSYGDKNSLEFDRLLGMYFHCGKSIRELKGLAPDTDYYNWLVNLNDFDYSSFEHKWILRNQSNQFITEYKKHPKLIESLIHKQQENMIEGVSWILFKYLLN